MRIHREGTRTLLWAAAGLAVLNGIAAVAAPMLVFFSLAISLILFYLLLNFFRNPKRSVQALPEHVLAPCDGKVVQIVRTQEPEFFGDQRLLISIFMSPFDVHVNRSPVAGRVVYLRYHPGRYLVAWHPKSSLLNERTTIVIESAGGSVLVRQIAGTVARRVVCYLHEGQHVSAGQEMGFIKFGSRLDVFLPLHALVRVAVGQRVRGGETLLAQLTPPNT
ncbi:MAG: phosphatidylserine decarboxylase family protein [Chitinophagales bacterium]|nr:phosphatidylserine decarboxylase family protein [Chitinophagales bacterium]MDW8427168.1 phosphatidylserine decarboxylase family protein [Chitinophagales bacterium]